MTELKNTKKSLTPDFPVDTAKMGRAAKKSARKVLTTVLTYVPAVIIFGLIALYYIQLSRMV